MNDFDWITDTQDLVLGLGDLWGTLRYLNDQTGSAFEDNRLKIKAFLSLALVILTPFVLVGLVLLGVKEIMTGFSHLTHLSQALESVLNAIDEFQESPDHEFDDDDDYDDLGSQFTFN